jgi:2-phosphoglycerate kinase
MQRLLVYDKAENSKVPFLRGILTRSLQNCGLDFERSYELASKVRDELAEIGEITTSELRIHVSTHLAEFGDEILHRYQQALATAPHILVRCRDGNTTPYSRGHCRQSLEACGFPAEAATGVANRLHDQLTHTDTTEIALGELRRLTFERLAEDLGSEAAQRYLVWMEFRHSNRPLIVLIGGTAGAGKSTFSTYIANLLEIVRIQSTDMLREVMRVMIPERLLPVLHTSTFNAWRKLPGSDPKLLENGYLQQVQLLSVACEAVIERALRERVSLILEGVHVHPKLIQRIANGSDAIIVPMTLAVLKRTGLRKRLRGRGRRAPDRRAQRYLDHFDELWRLQSFLLSEADTYGVPIVANEDKDRTLREMLGAIHTALALEFSGDLDKVLD